ncbi:MAG: lactonase family protein [Thermomicrobiales bacterium]|nr:lactonase family protein [Thermomicrobiales bacterium]
MIEKTQRVKRIAALMDRRAVLRTTFAGGAAVTALIAGSRFGLAQDASPVPNPPPAGTPGTVTPDTATPIASPVAEPNAPQFAYVGSDSRTAIAAGAEPDATGISVYSVDPESGALSLVQTVPSDNPFFFAFDPTGQFLYAVNVIGDYEGTESGSVEAYAIDPATGELTFLNRVSSGGAVAAQPAVDPTGSFVVVANYNGENVTVLPINPDGSLGEVVSSVTREGTGPNAARQEMSHPHAAVFDPGGDFVVVADLGTDEVIVYRLDLETGALTEVSVAGTAAGAGPRHVAFYADGTILYVVNELDATISVFAYDPASGTIGEELQTISTVPDPFEGTKSTAEIMIHPSGRFLYNSNRGQPDTTTPEGDAIVGFAIDPETGLLTLIGHTTDEIGVPWSFAFDASGRYLYAANYDGDSITQYAIDQETGELTNTGQTVDVPKPFVIQMSTP